MFTDIAFMQELLLKDVKYKYFRKFNTFAFPIS